MPRRESSNRYIEVNPLLLDLTLLGRLLLSQDSDYWFNLGLGSPLREILDIRKFAGLGPWIEHDLMVIVRFSSCYARGKY